MDAPSDLIRVISLTGGVFLDAEFTAPWCVFSHVEPEEGRPYLLEARHIISFHYVVAGSLCVTVEGEPPLQLSAGDIVMLPRNDPHAPSSPLLATLPRLLSLNVTESGGGAWIASSFQFAARGIGTNGVGAASIISRLSELLFIEALRRYIASLPTEKQGWLAALKDPVISRV